MDLQVERTPGGLSLEPARLRQTPNADFSAVLESGARTALGVVAGGVRRAADWLPGGGFVTAVVDVVAGGIGEASGLETGDKWALLKAQEQLQDEGLDNSLRLLALQRRMQEETQTFTTLSNVMRSRHELAKTAIGNLR